MKTIIKLSGILMLLTSAAAHAGSIESIGTSKPASMETIGKAPIKAEKPILKLGGLRVGQIVLPAKEPTFKERLAMRRERAIVRQQQIDTAIRGVRVLD